jgi:serine/threonine-protein kinase ULK/ATG1
LWSVGVIIFQLFFNRLPFPASNIRELKYAIFNSNGVKLPENSDNPVSDICFDLINRLLQKDPNNRINFEDYFQHKFFSEEHKNELIKNLNKKREKKTKSEETKSKVENMHNEVINNNKNNEQYMELNVDFNEIG